MKELIKRSITGLIYIFLIVASALLGKEALHIVFLFFGMICLYEVQRLLNYKTIISYILLFGLILLNQTSSYIQEYFIFLIPVFIIVGIVLIKNLFSNSKSLINVNKHLVINFYIIPAFVLLPNLPEISIISGKPPQSEPLILIGYFLLVWCNDSFAYVFGKNFGRKKLFERISPKKTIEGFLGGAIMCGIAGIFFYHFTQTLSVNTWIGMAVLVSVFGTIGDLVQSKFKRIAQVKDSGNIIPGHGGIYDRMDSTVFSITFVYGFLILLSYVS